MEQFPSNNKFTTSKPERPNRRDRTDRPEDEQEERKKITPVVRGKAVKRKVPLSKRAMHFFIGDDGGRGIWGYVVGDILAPAARDMVEDAFIGGITRALRGENAGPVRRHRGGGRDYNAPYRSGGGRDRYREEPRREVSRRAREMHNFEEVVIPTRVEAEAVLDQMDEMIERYGHVSVAEFYELSGTSSNWTDRKWGWTDIDRANISRTRDSDFVINLPKPEPLD